MNRLSSTRQLRKTRGRALSLRKLIVLPLVLTLALAAVAVTMVALPLASAEAAACLAYLCEPEPEEEPTPNIARPRVSVAGKDLNGGTLAPGDEILWTITVKNLGDTLTQVAITDVVPTGTSYAAGSIQGVGANDSGSPTLKWWVGSLGCGDRVTVSFISRVDAGLPDGTLITNQASADSAQTPAGVSKKVTFEVGGSSDKTDDGKESDDSEKSEKDLSLSSAPTTIVASLEMEAGEGDSSGTPAASGASGGESSDSSDMTSPSSASEDATEGAAGDDSDTAAVADGDNDNGWKLGVGLGVGLGGLVLINAAVWLFMWRRRTPGS